MCGEADTFANILTLREPVRFRLEICIDDVFTFGHMVGWLVKNTILETFAQNAQNLAVDHFVAFELLICLVYANTVVGVALIDGWHTAQFLMIPRILLLVWKDYSLCERKKCIAFNFLYSLFALLENSINIRNRIRAKTFADVRLLIHVTNYVIMFWIRGTSLLYSRHCRSRAITIEVVDVNSTVEHIQLMVPRSAFWLTQRSG